MSNLKENLVYLATGVEKLDEDIKRRLSAKNVVSKEIFYSDILVESEVEAKTIILSRKLEGKIAMDEVILKLRESGVRIIFCLSRDFEFFDICLKCGVYDLLTDPIKPSDIIKVFEKPMEYKDVVKIKEEYDEYLKATGQKVDPDRVLEKAHIKAVKKDIVDKKSVVKEQVIETQQVKELDINGLFSGLEGLGDTSEKNDLLTEITVENETCDESDSLSIELNEEVIPPDETIKFVNEVKEMSQVKPATERANDEIMKIGRDDILELTEDQAAENDDMDQKDDVEEQDYFIEDLPEEQKKRERPLTGIQLPDLKSKFSFAKKKVEEQNEPDEVVIEKMPPKKKEKTADPEPRIFNKNKIAKSIGVIGSEKGVGTTYTSMLLAYALGRRKKVLYVVTNDELYSVLSLKEKIEEFPFDITLLNDELYKLHNLYDHIIYNCGSMRDNTISYNVFYTLQYKILMMSLLPYKTSGMDKNDAASYVEVVGVLGLKKDEKYLKGIDVRENFSDKKYLAEIERKLLGGNDYD